MGNIDHTALLSKQMKDLLKSSVLSDVTFIVEDRRIRAHRSILAARSRIFEELLSEHNSVGHETQLDVDEIKLDVPYKAFKTLLQFIYSGKLSISEIGDTVEIWDVLFYSHKYEVTSLKKPLLAYLVKAEITVYNVCKVFKEATRFNFESLVEKCHVFMDQNAVGILQTTSFRTLSPDLVCSVLERDSFYAPEVDIFKAVISWIRTNPNADEKTIISLVRLEVMDVADLMNVVRPTNKVEPNLIFDAVQKQANKETYLNYRYLKVIQQNIATKELGVQVVEGENKEALFDGILDSFTCHQVLEDRCIMVQLGDVYFINHLKIFLWSDSLAQCYAYFVEVSVDRNIWKRVVDFSSFECRFWQDLYFAPVAVKYIRIVGTSARMEDQFKCSAFEAYFSLDTPRLESGLYAPMTILEGSWIPDLYEIEELVTEGVNLNNFAYFNVNSSTIRIELNQPFIIDSFSLLMNDDSVSIEVILYFEDSKDGEQLGDTCKVESKPWHYFSLKPRPVSFILLTHTFGVTTIKLELREFICPSTVANYLSSLNMPLIE